MSDYSDIWFEMNRTELEKGFRVKDIKKRMLKELSSDNMIRIMFEHYISDLSDTAVIQLGDQYLNSQ